MARVVRGARVIPAERVRALRDAESLVDSARAEAAAIRDAARAQGLDEARSEAAALLVAAGAARDRMLKGVQADVVVLAMEVARKVIRRELDLDPDTVVELCAGALRQVVLAHSITLRVNPDDLAAVDARRQTLAAALESCASLQIVADRAVDRGGCVVESDMGRIDARLETQLAAIERALMADDG